MSRPATGSRHTYDAPDGLAAQVADNLSDDMRQLDLHPGTEVAVAGYDEDRGLVLVEWADRQGNPRITSVEPDHFDQHFKGA